MSTASIIDRFAPQHELDCAAQALSSSDRQAIALDALAGHQPITELAQQHQISRKFVYQQKGKAQEALDEAFEPGTDDPAVLFYLPVTKAWLRQGVLGLVLMCHSSFRGVMEFFEALLDHPMSLGSVHTIVRHRVEAARQVQAVEALSSIRVGAHDEIFQSHHPILVGCDVDSTYCYLLAQEAHRDAATWGVHLLDLQAQGLDLEHPIAEFVVGGMAMVRDVEVLILQETSLGEHWINLTRAIEVSGDPNTAIVETFTASLPESFTLGQNYPNPFNSGTVIRFELPASQEVALSIYNMSGQKVATLVQGVRAAGSYAVHWDGRDAAGRSLASGMYVYRLAAREGQVETRKLLLLR